MGTNPDIPEVELVEEADRVLRWRHTSALRLGLPDPEAWEFAQSEGDLHVLEEHIANGCDPIVASRIVR